MRCRSGGGVVVVVVGRGGSVACAWLGAADDYGNSRTDRERAELGSWLAGRVNWHRSRFEKWASSRV